METPHRQNGGVGAFPGGVDPGVSNRVRGYAVSWRKGKKRGESCHECRYKTEIALLVLILALVGGREGGFGVWVPYIGVWWEG